MRSAAQVGQNWWLSVWAGATEAASSAGAHVPTHYYLGIYFCMGAVSLTAQFLRGLFLLYGSLNASQTLHTNLLTKVCSPLLPVITPSKRFCMLA